MLTDVSFDLFTISGGCQESYFTADFVPCTLDLWSRCWFIRNFPMCIPDPVEVVC